MAMEPATLFSRAADPAKVARRLRELAPEVKLDGPDDDWRNAVVAFRTGKQTHFITLTYDPEYHREPNWSRQMDGMQGYFSRFPASERQSTGLLLPSTFQFSLGVLFDPDEEVAGDRRLALLYDIAEFLDGVLFTPTALRDARGRILFGAAGDIEEDPDATWPRVLATVDISAAKRTGVALEPDDAKDAPSPARVARRALAMVALTARAILEQGGPLRTPEPSRFGWLRSLFSNQDALRRDVLKWVADVGIHDELEPDEWAILQRPIGKLAQAQQIQATWRHEGLVILAWALGRFEIPPPDRLVHCESLWQGLGLYDIDAARQILNAPSLRNREELGILRARLFTLHWRLRSYWITPTAIDFAEVARTNTFGLDLAGIPLDGGDLALLGTRIDKAGPDAFGLAHSISLERHTAVNWLWEGPEKYSEASQAT